MDLWLLLQHHYKGLVWRTKSQFLATKELISKMGKRSTWMLAESRQGDKRCGAWERNNP